MKLHDPGALTRIAQKLDQLAEQCDVTGQPEPESSQKPAMQSFPEMRAAALKALKAKVAGQTKLHDTSHGQYVSSRYASGTLKPKAFGSSSE